MSLHPCRFCGAELRHTFADLGVTPLSNSYLTEEQLDRMEPFYPLHARLCEKCLLVQLPEYESPENIFQDYAYFSSYSETWVAHARGYCEDVAARFHLGPSSHVVEIASNDGYLLRNFVERGVPVTGVEPARNVAEAARARGVPTVTDFFGQRLARELAAEGKQADLLLGNNVLAHVPDLNDFVAGLKILLKPDGVVTMEFPHLLRLIEGRQFDTIYHEHFSYFSFTTVERVFAAHGLTLFDVEELATHGGSLRIYARHEEDTGREVGRRVEELKAREQEAGMTRLETYLAFDERVRETKRALLSFLVEAKRAGKRVAGYGAPAKGNTLLNYCGVRTDFIDYTVDANPHKQNRYLPGTRIPIHRPDRLRETRPDYVLVLPWNLLEEITRQVAYVREWGGRFVVPVPEARVVE
ncbi:MAG TPA: class I SAM-dependent methyltransferase [Pyrinomonadaceae bacterium]|nr:class I SAM-dependent methyltransferase [Pyrinomonadaceae bacterium]